MKWTGNEPRRRELDGDMLGATVLSGANTLGQHQAGILDWGEAMRIGTAVALFLVFSTLMPASPAGTGDAVLSAAGVPVFFLDMESVPATSDLRRWLAEPHVYRALGAIWNITDREANVMQESMSSAYDGLIFVEEGHAAQGLSTPPRPAM